jgi:hypothetical protein
MGRGPGTRRDESGARLLATGGQLSPARQGALEFLREWNRPAVLEAGLRHPGLDLCGIAPALVWCPDGARGSKIVRGDGEPRPRKNRRAQRREGVGRGPQVVEGRTVDWSPVTTQNLFALVRRTARL